MAIDPRDPDASLVAVFKHSAVQNPAKTTEAGRPIFEDIEVVEIRAPGSRNWQAFPAHSVSHWKTDQFTGAQVQVTYAERFAKQYQQFKAHAAQTKSGTPLAHAPFLTEAKRSELRAQNIYTVEQLAVIDGQELKNLGPGGRELKNQAIELIEVSKQAVPGLQLQAELDALRARNQLLEEDNEALKQRAAAASEGPFEEMTTDQIRDYITVNTGHAPQGSLNRKMLIRMAMDARPTKAA